LPYPTLYDVTYSYTGFQEAQGDNSFPGTQLDADLEGLNDSLNDLSAFMQNVIRSDGALVNGIVTYDSLSASLQTAGLAPADAWLTATDYAVGENVIESSSLYRCLVAHTSGVFATDLAAVKWLLVTALPAGPQGVQGIQGIQGIQGVQGNTGATGAGYGGTSATSLLIANSVTKVFTTQAGLAYQVGNYVRASSAANGANYMEGLVSDYTGTSLSIAVTKIGGAGTLADWRFSISGAPGSGDLLSTNNLSDLVAKYTAKDNISVHGADVASATTTNLETATGDLIDVTGTTAITAITLSEGHERTVRFTGALTLTHGASLVLPGSTNITTAAGDMAVFRGYAAGVVRCVGYSRLSGKPVVANTAAEVGAQAVDAQLFSNIPQNSQSAAYTLIATDAQKHIFHPDADTTARIWTIPSNASVPFAIGTAVTFINGHGAGVITIAITSDTMRLAGAGTTGSRTLAANGMATAIKVAATEWKISGTGLT
jgi:hypothetical protein